VNLRKHDRHASPRQIAAALVQWRDECEAARRAALEAYALALHGQSDTIDLFQELRGYKARRDLYAALDRCDADAAALEEAMFFLALRVAFAAASRRAARLDESPCL
jgi:inorganic triphosphatase YgiF